AFYYAGADIVNITNLTFSVAKKVFVGDVEFGKAFGGPVKIAQLAAKSADVGIESFLFFLAILSLSLAIINIMPFPVLDGGHLVIIIIETIARREIPLKVKLAIQNTGFVLLLILMAFIIYNDIISF
ncbi:MAG TPA: site-2 protease family protein, partial [Ignavibacteriaceae bacterium]